MLRKCTLHPHPHTIESLGNTHKLFADNPITMTECFSCKVNSLYYYGSTRHAVTNTMFTLNACPRLAQAGMVISASLYRAVPSLPQFHQPCWHCTLVESEHLGDLCNRPCRGTGLNRHDEATLGTCAIATCSSVRGVAQPCQHSDRCVM